MARTAATVNTLTANNNVAVPTTTAVDVANGHVITGVPAEQLIIIANLTFAGAKTITIKAGANPPALAAGQGDHVVSINNSTRWIGPLTSARFQQADGSVYVDYEAGSTGTITVVRLPRTA
jgi:hypothetical protein